MAAIHSQVNDIFVDSSINGFHQSVMWELFFMWWLRTTSELVELLVFSRKFRMLKECPLAALCFPTAVFVFQFDEVICSTNE